MTMSVYISLTTTGCSVCDISFAVPETFWRRGQERGGEIYCPSGHKMTFGQGENERLKAERARLTAQLDQERARAKTLERSRAAVQGQLTKTKKRVANGVCPCCNRSFVNLTRHMQGQHPDYADAPTDA